LVPIELLNSQRQPLGSSYSLTWAVGAEAFAGSDAGSGVVLDEDLYWVANPVDDPIVFAEPTHPGARLFRVEWDRNTVLSYLRQSGFVDILWQDCTALYGSELQFLAHLRANDPIVSPVLRFIARSGTLSSLTDEWRESHSELLLQRLIQCEHVLRQHIYSLPGRKWRTRFSAFYNVQRAVAHIHRFYSRSLDIAELASVASMSHWYLARVFHAVTGLTPREYVQRKRLAVAVRLIRRTQLDLVEVAARVGFEDRRTLHSRLVQYYGVPATALKLRGGLAPPVLTSAVTEIRKPHDALLFSTG
jgi:AraC-like DNA-binding protein